MELIGNIGQLALEQPAPNQPILSVHVSETHQTQVSDSDSFSQTTQNSADNSITIQAGVLNITQSQSTARRINGLLSNQDTGVPLVPSRKQVSALEPMMLFNLL